MGWSGSPSRKSTITSWPMRGIETPPQLLAGPRAGDADPAARVLVLLAVAVPVELHLHPPVLVGVDLLAAGPDHHRGLRAAHRGPGRRPRRAELLLALEHRHRAAVGRVLVDRRLVGVVPQVPVGADDQIVLLLVLARSVGRDRRAGRPRCRARWSRPRPARTPCGTRRHAPGPGARRCPSRCSRPG